MSYGQFDVALYFHNNYSRKRQKENLCLVHVLLYRPKILFPSKLVFHFYPDCF